MLKLLIWTDGYEWVSMIRFELLTVRVPFLSHTCPWPEVVVTTPVENGLEIKTRW